MSRPVAVDSSVIVAALMAAHERHAVALRALQGPLKDKELIVPVPALVEAFAALTRLPVPHRVAPGTAREMLDWTFASKTRIVGLDGDEVWGLIGEASAAGTGGATTYDAQIVACARKAGAEALITLVRRNYDRLAADIELIVP